MNMNTPAALATTAAATSATFARQKMKECGQYPRAEQQQSNPRFIPRCCTPLSALAPLGVVSSLCGFVGGSPGAGGKVRARSSAISASGGPDDGTAMEVDFIGCVFGVTVERFPSLSSSSLPANREEVFATVDSIVSGGLGAGSSSSNGGPRDGPSVEVAGLASPQAATAGATPTGGPVTAAPPDDEFVIYRVYLTDASGAIVVLKKRIRRELARHHRILRSAPGACWAIMNADRRDHTPSLSSSVLGTRRPCNDRGVGTVSWSSMTAVGGNGCAPPPRSIGGAPAGHLEQPLLALRRWVEGGEGRNAMSRARQRLGLLLARERRIGAAGASPSPNAAAMAGEVATEEEEVSPPLSRWATSTVAGVASAVPAVVAAAAPGEDDGGDADSGPKHGPTSSFSLGMGTLVPTTPAGDAVMGFVSSFAFHVDIPSPVVAAVGRRGFAGGGTSVHDGDHSLWLKVDTGEQVLAFVLPEASFKKLLNFTLSHDKGHPLAMRGAAATAEPEDRGIGGGDQLPPTKRLPNDTVHDLLDRAVTVLGNDDSVRQEEGASGVQYGESELCTSTPQVAVAAAAAARSTVGENVAAASPPSVAVAERHRHQHQPPPPVVSPNNETTIDALVSAVCRLFYRGQEQSHRHIVDSCGGAGAFSPGVGGMTALTVAGSRAVRTKTPLATAGPDEGGSRSNAIGTISDAGRARSLVDVLPSTFQPRVGAEAGKEAGADDGTTSAEPNPATANPDGVGHCRAAPAVPETSRGGLDWTRRGRGGRGGSLGMFLGDLAVACGGKQIAFSISRSFSLKLGREVGVVQGIGCVDVARSSENLLKDLAVSHVPPS